MINSLDQSQHKYLRGGTDVPVEYQEILTICYLEDLEKPQNHPIVIV